MSRLQRKIKYAKQTWTVNSLVPADFLSVSYWPFAYYRLPEDIRIKPAQEIKRVWNIKPKAMASDEEKLSLSIKKAFEIGLSLHKDSEYEEIKQDETKHNILLAEIYSLTYRLKPVEKLFTPFEIISRDFAESLAIKAKTLCVEPYSFLVDISGDIPELYNPKRYDFNWFILGIGWDKERREYEKAQSAMQSKAKMRVR